MTGNLAYLVAAYAVFWAFTFALALSIWTRQRRLERQLRDLEEQLGDDQTSGVPGEPDV